MIWRRQAKDESRDEDPARVLPDSEEVRRRWEEWEARWNPREEERVARWLKAKSAGGALETGSFDTTREQADWALFQAQQTQEAQPDGELESVDLSPVDPSPAVNALKTELAGLEHQRRQLAAELEAERVEAEHQKAQLAAELDAERTALQDERRNLVSAFQQDQLEVERLGRHLTETKAMLEAEVAALSAEMASLEDRRREIIETMEAAVAATERSQEAELAAVAAAERAREAELAAVDHLADVQEQAKKVEQEQFEIWVALDAEVTALRNQLHAPTQLVSPDPEKPAPPEG